MGTVIPIEIQRIMGMWHPHTPIVQVLWDGSNESYGPTLEASASTFSWSGS